MWSKLTRLSHPRLLLSSLRQKYGFAQGKPNRDLYGDYSIIQKYLESRKMHRKTK